MQKNSFVIRHGVIARVIIIVVLIAALYLIVCKDTIIAKVQKGYMAVDALTADEIERRLESSEKTEELPEILFNDHEIAYDIREEKYYVTQNMNSRTWDGFFTCSRGRLYWEEDEYFRQPSKAIEEGHTFTLYCIDEETGDYCVSHVIFTGMPTMAINTVAGETIGDDIQEATVGLSDMKFQGREWQKTGCEVAVRGQSSKGFPKQGYKLVLDKKLSLLGMREDEDWILAALWDDDGLIHNKFSYDVWRNIASSNLVAKDDGTTMEYVELFCNDTYMGVYGLVERIDKKELSLDKKDILYKCSGFQMPDETLGEDFGLSESFEIKHPGEYDAESWLPLKEYLDIYFKEGAADYEEAITAVNLENAIDFNIFIILTRAHDNWVRKNICYVAEYLHDGSGGYKIIKVPWDCNATWGQRLYKGDRNRKLYEPEWITDAYIWSMDTKNLYQTYPDQIQELTLKRWKELRKDILSEERLIAMLDEEFAYLHGSGAYDRNYVRWEEHGREHWEDEYIYEYVTGRLAFLDAYFEEPYFAEEYQ